MASKYKKIYPARVVDADSSGITVENSTGKRRVKSNTVQVKEGDYVLVQGGTIVEKITRREAEQIERSLPQGE